MFLLRLGNDNDRLYIIVKVVARAIIRRILMLDEAIIFILQNVVYSYESKLTRKISIRACTSCSSYSILRLFFLLALFCDFDNDIGFVSFFRGHLLELAGSISSISDPGGGNDRPNSI